jgi:diguanylate cyclase (GGDEF)-like protein
MFRMDPARLQQMLDELHQAARDHEAWQGKLLRNIVCRVPPGDDHLDPDGHRHCHFGQWYYGARQDELRVQPAFAAIEAEHLRLHRLAARVLHEAAASEPVSTQDYDELLAASARLRYEIDTLRHDLETALRNRDALTGVYGRIEILPALREALELERRGVQQSCVVFMDLDRFKEVNDRCGHLVGDQVLAGAARYVGTHLRSYDRLFRYGGDEFLILLPGVHIEGAHRLIDRLRAGLASAELAHTEDGEPLRITASFGVTPLEPDVVAEESIDRADKALLLAKSAGRNRVMRWDPTVTTAILQGAPRRAAGGGGAAGG